MPRNQKATVKAGRSTRKVPAGTLVSAVKARLDPEGRGMVLIRGDRVMRDNEKLSAGTTYIAQPNYAGA